MAKGREKKKQHFVPKAYLSAWVDPTSPSEQSYVWLFDKTGGDGKRKGPENTFTQTDFYTIPMPDGSRNLRIENGLSHLEGGLQDLRVNFLERHKQIPAVRHVKLMAFLAAMEARTPAFRDHHRALWNEVLRMGEEMAASMEGKSADELRRLAGPRVSGRTTFTMEQARELAERPIQNMLPAAISAQVQILSQMQSTVVVAPPGKAFITSDAPAYRYDPEAHKRPFQYQGAGLGWPTTEVILPLSPRQALIVHHGERVPGIKPIKYASLPGTLVDELNRRTQIFADKTIVSHQGVFDRNWMPSNSASISKA
ncbi:DUF4238 domain-containing protein [Sinorhizobium fredii]|uniref:DUF4238 domain-containing protein n=1 Tax=Rhizobium fredii TaxID=380 RepID=UPI000568C6D9|nr:DUF4238 domain-containing protein [Sinorhizobium fredii]ASY74319.1 hypothetical protein SF83666_d69340 [Sinorhizobium fredii CCBAU 83666]